MNSFIKILMESTNNGGGTFTTRASFRLDNIPTFFSNVEVKIDTGCSLSTIPIGRFFYLKPFCKILKKNDIINGIPHVLSYGVESSGFPHDIPQKEEDKINCPALKFQHWVSNVSIAGMNMDDFSVFLNYDRRGHILIGMDVLKEWDFHCGLSGDGTNVFLGCPLIQLNDEYYKELNRVFGLKR